jgi:hypothetical protein
MRVLMERKGKGWSVATIVQKEKTESQFDLTKRIDLRAAIKKHY